MPTYLISKHSGTGYEIIRIEYATLAEIQSAVWTGDNLDQAQEACLQLNAKWRKRNKVQRMRGGVLKR